MAFNGSGTFSRVYNWVTDKSNSIKVTASRMDAEFDGIATGLSTCIAKDGQTTISANIPFNNKKITGLADATLDTDAMNRQTSDGRYVRNGDALTALTAVAADDLLFLWDTSASANKTITYANLKAQMATDGAIFSSGDKTIFYMATAPTGWTKVTTAALNNAALRLVTGTGAATGGTDDFTSVFAARTITQANLPSFTLPDTLAISGGSSVTHSLVETRATDGTASGSVNVVSDITFSNSTVSLKGSVTSGGSGDAMSFAVKYADFIVCTKD